MSDEKQPEDVAPIYYEFSGWRYTEAEKQSQYGRLRYAEGLISQLPKEHNGRATWLLNYGTGPEAQDLRERRGIGFNGDTRSAETSTPLPKPEAEKPVEREALTPAMKAQIEELARRIADVAVAAIERRLDQERGAK